MRERGNRRRNRVGGDRRKFPEGHYRGRVDSSNNIAYKRYPDPELFCRSNHLKRSQIPH